MGKRRKRHPVRPEPPGGRERLESVLADLDLIERKPPDSWRSVEDLEQAWLRQQKRLQNLRSDAADARIRHEAGVALQRVRTRLTDCARRMLASFNRRYGSAFTWEEVVGEREAFFYANGFWATIERNDMVQKAFSGVLERLLPGHPKDEYPAARRMRRTFILHVGPTNSGKTHAAVGRLRTAHAGVYLAPLRLLALEIAETLTRTGCPCSLRTGEEEIEEPGARHESATVEKVRFDKLYDVAVIDEAQMIADPERGYAWTRAILGLRAREIHVCCAPQARGILEAVIRDCGDHVTVVEHERTTPLVFEPELFAFPGSLQAHDAYIVFSKRSVLRLASYLAHQGVAASVVYGELPPEVRRQQMNLFASGQTRAVVSTDAIGMGMNLPIRRIVFCEAEKFDGERLRPLLPEEIQQIAGRAGRLGLFETGFVAALRDARLISQSLAQTLPSIEQAYVAPVEQTITALPVGTLGERIAAWGRHEGRVGHYAKRNVERMLRLARLLEPLGIGVEQGYRAICVPFDERSELVRLWLSYVRQYLRHGRVARPERTAVSGDRLEAYEYDYRALELYYSFSKAFDLTLDVRWVRAEKRRTAARIEAHLRAFMKDYTLCRRCRKARLEWWSPHTLCDACHAVQYGQGGREESG